MNKETKQLYDKLVLAIAKEIAEEQGDCNNLDYQKPILSEYYYLFNNDFFYQEIVPVVICQIINLGKSQRVGKFDNEMPPSYKRRLNRELNLYLRSSFDR